MTDTPLRKFIFWLLVVIAGSGYGLIGYSVFSYFFSGSDRSGVMTASFLIGIPFSGSATVAYALNYYKNTPFRKVLKGCYVAVAIGILLSVPIFKEGSICIAIFLILALIPCAAGAALGHFIAKIQREQSRATFMSVLALLPLAAGGIEQHISPAHRIYETKQSILIQASPEVVWKEILNPNTIQLSEFEQGLANKIGIPYPVNAYVVQPGVGGIRKSIWQRGVSFEEEITAFEPNHRIEWIYHFTPESFPPGSLDDHVKVGGSYFDVKNTSCTLRPSAEGTYLDVSVQYRVSTSFNWYAVPWADFFIRNTAQSILQVYKNRAEKDTIS